MSTRKYSVDAVNETVTMLAAAHKRYEQAHNNASPVRLLLGSSIVDVSVYEVKGFHRNYNQIGVVVEKVYPIQDAAPGAASEETIYTEASSSLVKQIVSALAEYMFASVTL